MQFARIFSPNEYLSFSANRAGSPSGRSVNNNEKHKAVVSVDLSRPKIFDDGVLGMKSHTQVRDRMEETCALRTAIKWISQK